MKKTPLALFLTLGLLQTPLSAFAATAPLDLVGPVSDYKIYVTENIEELVSHTQKFTDAVKKGDIATAKKLYAPTRVYYESSSRLPSCSVIWTPRLTHASTTTKKA